MGARRKSWSIPIADLVAPCLGAALARQGFGEADVIMHWPDIVGLRLAQWCEPIRLQWPARFPKASPETTPEPATLVIRVEGAFAIELQHQAMIVIERVNAHLGWRCVGRIALKQGPLGRSLTKRRKRHSPLPDAVAKARAVTSGITNEDLREALTRLGAHVLDRKESGST